MVDEPSDPVEAALGPRMSMVRKLRLALVAVLVAVIIAKLLGLFDPSWRLILWLTAAIAVLPPLLVSITIARTLERPGSTSPRDDDAR